MSKIVEQYKHIQINKDDYNEIDRLTLERMLGDEDEFIKGYLILSVNTKKNIKRKNKPFFKGDINDNNEYIIPSYIECYIDLTQNIDKYRNNNKLNRLFGGCEYLFCIVPYKNDDDDCCNNDLFLIQIIMFINSFTTEITFVQNKSRIIIKCIVENSKISVKINYAGTHKKIIYDSNNNFTIINGINTLIKSDIIALLIKRLNEIE